MALAMSRPFKHPKTSVFWLRKRVPRDLQAVLGKREELCSLKTKDADEAKRLFAGVLDEIEKKWANLRKGQPTLTEREAHDLAVRIHDHWLETYRDNPSEQTFWQTDQAERLWTPIVEKVTGDGVAFRSDHYRTIYFEVWCTQQAEGLLAVRGLKVDDAGRLCSLIVVTRLRMVGRCSGARPSH